MLDLKALAFDKGIGQKELGKVLGVAQSQVSAMMNGKRVIRLEHFARLCEAYGKDFVESYILPKPSTTPFSATATILPTGLVDDLKEEIKDNDPKPEDLEVIDAEEVELKETYILTPEIVNQEGIDIQKELNEGTLEVQVKPTQDVLPPHELKIYTENDEMAPDIEVNDPVFARSIKDPAFFKPRYMYFVDLDIGGVVRWVDWANEEKTLVRLISRKAVDVVPLASIKSMAEIVVITKRPKTLPVDIEPVERKFEKKEQQLNTLLEQQGELIGIIKEQLK